MKEHRVHQALGQARRLFWRQNLRVWLDSGTLLGAVRNGIVIPWDNDVDLATWKHEIDCLDKALFWRDAHKSGFDTYLLDDKFVLLFQGIPINVSLFERDGDVACRKPYPLDICLLGKASRALWWVFNVQVMTSQADRRWQLLPSASAKRLLTSAVAILPTRYRRRFAVWTRHLCLSTGCKMVNKMVPVSHFANFGSIRFYEEYWDVPYNVDGYLTYRYGPDWRVPRKRWNHWSDDGALDSTDWM